MFIKLFFITIPIFFGIDLIWLSLVARKFYQEQIGFLMKSDINWVAAIVFYFLFVIGLILFVIQPSLEKGSWVNALLFGALFGLISYATYDLTNLATIKDWPILVTIVDLIWGSVLAGSVSLISYFVVSKLGL